MCGSGHNRTLDRLMTQMDHAIYVVFGPNPFPACACNSRRGSALIGDESRARILDHYFDDVLSLRLLSARFGDLGQVPHQSIRVVLVQDHLLRPAVDFQLKSVVLPSGIDRTLLN
ncbi:hypothetical protein EDF57_101889 [Novosphingobium sp. PhB55]|nr:hypothetical protein EDF57_101889 [Novosphingobium sp. PhB55]